MIPGVVEMIPLHHPGRAQIAVRWQKPCMPSKTRI